MIKIYLKAINPAQKKFEELVLNENCWRPILSVMHVANCLLAQMHNAPALSYEQLGDLDDNSGYVIEDDYACKILAKEMRTLMTDPFLLGDYGMSITLENEKTYFTYPVETCTAYLEDIENGQFYETIWDNDIVGRRVRSWFRASDTELLSAIEFLENCGGFVMP